MTRPSRLVFSAVGRAMRVASEFASASWMSPWIFSTETAAGRVAEISDFGSNPGALRMLVYAPGKRPPPGAPLVVVLHGCHQNAVQFATDAGWLGLADQLRLTLLLPEQSADNNRGRCFNWFRPSDTRRGSGEAMSIRQMVRVAIRRSRADPRRIFIVGLSAGAAMAAGLLAAYPAVFAAGAVVAGLPVGCASNAAHAVVYMGHADSCRTRRSWAAAVRDAAPARATKPWPRLSIWQGGRDRTVDPANAEALAAQWTELHGLGPIPAIESEAAPGVRHRAWGQLKRPAVELWTIASMGHGFPVNPRQPGGGREGAWMQDAGLCAAQLIASFWGIDRRRAHRGIPS